MAVKYSQHVSIQHDKNEKFQFLHSFCFLLLWKETYDCKLNTTEKTSTTSYTTIIYYMHAKYGVSTGHTVIKKLSKKGLNPLAPHVAYLLHKVCPYFLHKI